MNNYLNINHLNKEISIAKNEYINNSPYPHIIIDNFVKEDFLNNATSKLDDVSEFVDKKHFDPNEKRKKTSPNEKDIPNEFIELIRYFNSQTFLNYLQKITGIKEKLISDPYLWGGGIHKIKKGGFLKIHSDTNFHPNFKLDRRLNLLLYLNNNWKEEYGGHLELWNKQMTKCEQKILPVFNRAVIFSTDDTSYHGHPNPLNCPENVMRQSLALYYYSHGRSDVITDLGRGTYFKMRLSNKKDILINLKNLFEALMPPIIVKIIYKYILRYIKINK
jgi:Rps23 Pro-64 3,4-dihydroxylase Tpa1-like proline 4-hydroxylase